MKTSLILLVILSLVAVNSASASWSLASDFSATSNPSGAWSYGQAASIGSFEIFPWHGTDGSGGPVWSSRSDFLTVTPTLANVWKNTTSTVHYGAQPGQVTLHPMQNESKMAVVRWTSDYDGDATITGSFGQGDYGAVGLYIAKTASSGTTTFFSIPSTDSTLSFNITTSILVGDKIDFLVSTGGDGGGWDTTPLDVTIVPEPATISLLGVAAMGLLRGRRHRKQ
ncbi:MAG: PEP-CTERM sorting domain-containing protein [Phycisphaerae bacterium]|jgi:hypothetical protein